MTKEIELTQGQVALIDDDDFERVDAFKDWYAVWNPHARTFYAVRHGENTSHIFMHRFILGATRGTKVDHGDHNGLNNRRYNIRLCTSSQNAANDRTPKNNSTGYKGVTLASNGKFIAKIMIHDRYIYLGRFKSALEAARAYDSKARELFGVFAYTNLEGHEGPYTEG
jgi:hypothetical protein